jgi:hypothetical protein
MMNDPKLQYYQNIILSMGDPDLDVLSEATPLDIISLFISKCSMSDFKVLKDQEYELSQNDGEDE